MNNITIESFKKLCKKYNYEIYVFNHKDFCDGLYNKCTFFQLRESGVVCTVPKDIKLELKSEHFSVQYKGDYQKDLKKINF